MVGSTIADEVGVQSAQSELEVIVGSTTAELVLVQSAQSAVEVMVGSMMAELVLVQSSHVIVYSSLMTVVQMEVETE